MRLENYCVMIKVMKREVFNLSELKYFNKTLEYHLVLVLEDVLGKIRYLRMPWVPLDTYNLQIPAEFYNYDELTGAATPCFNKFDESFGFTVDAMMECFLEIFFAAKLNEIWAIPIKEIKALYYEFVYTHPFVFGNDVTNFDSANTFIDGTKVPCEDLRYLDIVTI